MNERYLERYNNLACKRDEKMLETINTMRSKFPDKTLFIVAGKNHITNPMIQEKLVNQPHIALVPKHEFTKKDVKDYSRRLIEIIEYTKTN